jgi:lysophospholipase L1-like esterase
MDRARGYQRSELSMRTALLRALHVIVAILLTLIASELALRWYLSRGVRTEEELRARLEDSESAGLEDSGGLSLFGMVRPSSDPDIVYELKPNLVGTFRGRSLRTNRAGLREDREYAAEKPTGVFRIVGIGDSNMFGWGLDQGRSYLDLLENRLAATRPHEQSYEVINCAVPGYNTTMEVATLRYKCLRYDPDLVVMHFVGNDFEPPFFMQSARRESSSRIVLFGLLTSLRRDGDNAVPDLWYRKNKELPAGVRNEAHARYKPMIGVQGYRRAMESLSRLSREHSLPVWVLVMGQGNASGVALETGRALGFRMFMAARRFGRRLTEMGLEPTRRARRATFQLPGDHHPNELAHELFAEELYEALVEGLPTREVTERTGRTEPSKGGPGESGF